MAFLPLLLTVLALIAQSEVIVLNDANFDEKVLSQPNALWLVEFYAPWCGHCKSLEPIFEKAAIELKGKAFLAKVDATENEVLGQRFDIQGYPTIKLIVAESEKYVVSYSGSRTVDAFAKFIETGYKSATKSKYPEKVVPLPTPSGPSNVVEWGEAEIEEAINSEKRWLVEFYAPWCGHCKQLTPIYEDTAKTMKDQHPEIGVAKVDATVHTVGPKRFNVKGFPTIVLIEKGSYLLYEGPRKVEDFVKFAQEGVDKEGKVEIPGKPSMFDEIIEVLHDLGNDIIMLWTHRKLLFLMIYMGGIATGAILVEVLARLFSSPPKPKPKPAAAEKKKDN